MKRKLNKKMFWVIAILFIIAVSTVALTNTDRLAVWSAPQKQAATPRPIANIILRCRSEMQSSLSANW